MFEAQKLAVDPPIVSRTISSMKIEADIVIQADTSKIQSDALRLNCLLGISYNGKKSGRGGLGRVPRVSAVF